jgi:CubicO group peptidase (beta-lactamase class C family)
MRKDRVVMVAFLAASVLALAGPADADEPQRPLFEPGLDPAGFLPRARPAAVGMDEDALRALVRDAEASLTDAIIVIKDGKVVVERTFGRPRGAMSTMSVTKSIVGLAVGMLIADGRIRSLDEPLGTWFPEWKEGAKRKVTLRHVLTHTSALAHKTGARLLYSQPDRLKHARESPLRGAPGSFSYNNEAAQLLAGVIASAAGKPVDVFLRERLFEPLGIKDATWDRDQAGNVNTFADLSLSGRDLARIGQLMLSGGRHEGRELVPAAWIAEATKPARADLSWYGLLWWIVSDERIIEQVPAELAGLRRAGLANAHKLEVLNGRTFTHRDAYLLEVGALLDPAERAALVHIIQAMGLPIRIRAGRPVGYKADGWLGQYLVVYPAEKLVAVRLRRQSEGGDEAENLRYGFRAFSERVLETLRSRAHKATEISGRRAAR